MLGNVPGLRVAKSGCPFAVPHSFKSPIRMSTFLRTTFFGSILTASLFASLGTAQQESRPASAPATAVAAPRDPAKAKAALTRAQEKNKKRDMTMDLAMQVSIMGMEISGSGKQTTSKDGKMVMELTMEMPMGQGTMKQKVVNDGKTYWQVQEMPGMGVTVIKGTVEEMKEMGKKMGGGPMGGGQSPDAESQLAEMQKQYDFDTLEESTMVDGKPYWAISGEMTKEALKSMGPGAAMMGAKRIRVLFTKDTDIFSGIEMLNAQGQKSMSMTYKNFNLEPKLTDETFAYTPPAGVKVTSLADAMRGAGTGMDEDEDEDEEEAAPASKPAK